MRFAKKTIRILHTCNSHSVILFIAFFLNFIAMFFLPHSEGTVGPILNSAFHEKDLQTSNSVIVLLSKTTRHAILS